MGTATGILRTGVQHTTVGVIVLLLLVLQPNVDAKRNGVLIELHEDNWRDMLTGEWMVEFFAPWCPACKSLAPIWERFALTAIDSGVNVAKIDVTTSPSLSGRFFVTALPTIYHVKDGEFRQYRGSRDGDALIQYIRLKQWQQAEQISPWKKPDTIHMSILSFFFKLSHSLKDLNGRLQEEYGLPSWGCYALFAVGTVFVGAALGLLLVCVVDFLYPPKRTPRQSFAESKQKGLVDGVEDLAQDDLEDDAESKSNSEKSESGSEDKNNEDDGEGEETSEGELISQTESDNEKTSESDEKESPEEEQLKQKKDEDKEDTDAKVEEAMGRPTDVRKRKPRKAD